METCLPVDDSDHASHGENSAEHGIRILRADLVNPLTETNLGRTKTSKLRNASEDSEETRTSSVSLDRKE